MKNSTIRERYAALTVLSQRVLPSRTAVNKVVALLTTRFEQPFRATELQRKQIIAQHPVPAGWDRPALPHDVAEARERSVEEMLACSIPVRAVPESLRLTAADLPVALKGEGGESNVAELASIVLALGSLYRMGDDEAKLRASDPDAGEEPDDTAPTAAE